MKPGVKTSEFWLSTIVAFIGPIVAILVASGIVTPEAEGELAGAIEQLIAAIAVIIGVWGGTSAAKNYTNARAAVKQTGSLTGEHDVEVDEE